LTETWARVGAPDVRVNELMLGIFETRHAEHTRGWGTAHRPNRNRPSVDHTLLERTGRLDDVVRAVRFLIEDAPYMTGSVLRLDGGYVLGGDQDGPYAERGRLVPCAIYFCRLCVAAQSPVLAAGGFAPHAIAVKCPYAALPAARKRAALRQSEPLLLRLQPRDS
jgi:hypothetical protein